MHSKGGPYISPPGSLLLTVLRPPFSGNSYLMFLVGVSCRILYSIVSYLICVSCSGSITMAGEERANLSAIDYLRYMYLVSVRRGFLFLLVLGMGCVILLWHSLCIPYNHLGQTQVQFVFYHRLKL